MESSLRDVVSRLAGSDDAAWIIFEGQSVDWLVSNGLAVLTQREPMERWPTQIVAQFREALSNTQTAYRTRNIMIHGEWRTDCFMGEGCIGRSVSIPADGPVFHVHRSRYRKGLEERQIAIVDIEALAEHMRELEYELRDAMKKAGDAWLGSIA
jgi:hypothetical protein